jgi:hypothetical protein
VIHMRLLFCRLVPEMTRLHHLLLALQLHHCSSLIFFLKTH